VPDAWNTSGNHQQKKEQIMIDEDYDYPIEGENDTHLWRNIALFATFGLGAYVAYKVWSDPEGARELGRKVRDRATAAKDKVNEKVNQWGEKASEFGHSAAEKVRKMRKRGTEAAMETAEAVNDEQRSDVPTI
jgi:hypothetical protein